ncbi:uncharacterized protein LOC126744792 [Anthonomus grandis grandis]|uniref:uncharacterized protein LOC126744792 n=1 Tax=Anthonomus grandis grandis TaxID=2921223 RepID=UPI002165A386|nr:uncharacterized protein LOC126744792 [Anthonomus grandis grandis]
MSAAGSFVPPFLIFLRRRFSPLLAKDGPPDAEYQVTFNGWTNEEMFELWLRHFVKFVKTNRDEPVLLILDNHSSHATLESYNYCKENFITILSLPTHLSHLMQPLDVTFYGPLKKSYYKECDNYTKSNNLTQITPYDVASLFNKAYSKVASLEKGISGFRCTGIFPYQPDIFTDANFVYNCVPPACVDTNEKTTGSPASSSKITEANSKDNAQNQTRCPVIHKTPTKDKSSRSCDPVPGCSTWQDESDQSINTSSISDLLSIISPLPQKDDNKSKNLRQTQNSIPKFLPRHLFPIRYFLKKKSERNKNVMKKITCKGMKAKNINKTKNNSKIKSAKRQVGADELCLSEDEEPLKKTVISKYVSKTESKPVNKYIKYAKGKVVYKKGTNKRQVDEESSFSEDEEISDDDECDDLSDSAAHVRCIICDDFGKNNELWYRCTNCGS